MTFHYNDLASVEALSKPSRRDRVLRSRARADGRSRARDSCSACRSSSGRRGAPRLRRDRHRVPLAPGRGTGGVRDHPDLSTLGKAIANGFALSALAGRREIMRLGGREHDQERVFLLSTTHGAEHAGLAAGIATMATYRDEPVIETLHAPGDLLRRRSHRGRTTPRHRGPLHGGRTWLVPVLRHR